MNNVKKTDGIKIFGYALIALILMGIGFLSSMAIQHFTGFHKSATLSSREAAVPVDKTTVGKYSDKNEAEPVKEKTESVLESPYSERPVQGDASVSAKSYPPAGILDVDDTHTDMKTGKGFVTADIAAGKKAEVKVKTEKQKKSLKKTSPEKKQVYPSIASEKWEKSANTNVYVIHGDKRIDPYTGRVIETINSGDIPVRRIASPAGEKVINNYYYNDTAKKAKDAKEDAAEEKEEKEQASEDNQASTEDKEFWYGGYSAISRNPQTTIGEAYRERLKNWPSGNDMSYSGSDTYYGGYSSSSGYVNMGNIYFPTGGSDCYGRSYGVTGYVKIGNIYMPVGTTYYRR